MFGRVQRRDKDKATRKQLQMTVYEDELWQTKAEMARRGERGYGQKPDDNSDGRRPKTLACHDPSRHTTKCRGGKVRRIITAFMTMYTA